MLTVDVDVKVEVSVKVEAGCSRRNQIAHR